jgi:hypothetical protein
LRRTGGSGSDSDSSDEGLTLAEIAAGQGGSRSP